MLAVVGTDDYYYPGVCVSQIHTVVGASKLTNYCALLHHPNGGIDLIHFRPQLALET